MRSPIFSFYIGQHELCSWLFILTLLALFWFFKRKKKFCYKITHIHVLSYNNFLLLSTALPLLLKPQLHQNTWMTFYPNLERQLLGPAFCCRGLSSCLQCWHPVRECQFQCQLLPLLLPLPANVLGNKTGNSPMLGFSHFYVVNQNTDPCSWLEPNPVLCLKLIWRVHQVKYFLLSNKCIYL